MAYMIKISQKIRLLPWFFRGIAVFFLQLFMLVASSHAGAPVITNPTSGSTLPTIAVGQSMRITIYSIGGVAPLDRWVECDANDPDYDSEAPCLPPGLVLDASPGSATTDLHGTPTTAGAYTFSITLNDDNNDGGVAKYYLLVTSPAVPTLTSVAPNSGSTAGSTSVKLTGNNLTGATAVSFGGTAALDYAVNNATTITATTPAHAAGAVNVTIITPGGSATLVNGYTYNVPVPVAGAASAMVAANSSANLVTLNLSGGAATSVAIASAASHGTATASGTSITYTPTAGYSGSDSFTYTATNTSGTSSPATITITVKPPTIVFTPTSLPNGTVGSSYSTTVSASGGMAPYSYTITAGTLPIGLSLNTSTGVISNTPYSSGTTDLTITATDTNGATGSRAYTFTINAQAPVAGAVSATVAANSSANPITLNLSGGAATSVAIASAASHGTATASGTSITYTPTAGYSGPDSFTYTATNATGTSSAATVSINVSAPTLAVAPASLNAGLQGTTYSATVSASGGTAPYSYTISSGSLPAGLTLNTSTGNISGILSASGTSSFTVTATDANGAKGSRAYSVAVTAPVAETVPLPGNAGNASVLVTSTQAGCTVSPGTLRISASGIPSSPANASFPVGALFFSTTGCAGAKLQVQVDYPAGSLAGLTMQKYGPHGQPPMQVGWFTPPDLAVNGNSVSYSVTDDGEGDNETTVPGVITDPFAPMLLAAPAASHAIPTISEWGLIVLSALMSIFGLARMRRQV
ncbi:MULTISPECIES: IPTL-CTERM sorting domain-containing protein [Delftia]|nr:MULTISPECIES: IPTL-CTERM sorting domain-containing protein [Delftia]